MRSLIMVTAILALLLATVAAFGDPPKTVTLLAGLESGDLWAEFKGAGDSAVAGVVSRIGTDPLIVQIDGGTQFLAQAGGRQGQNTLGTLSIDLTNVAIAQVTIPTACTNLGLPPATVTDVMTPVVCPDSRLARLACLPAISTTPRPAAQLAVWALTDNPRPRAVSGYLQEMSAAGASEVLIRQASDLIVAAGLNPRRFRLFR